LSREVGQGQLDKAPRRFGTRLQALGDHSPVYRDKTGVNETCHHQNEGASQQQRQFRCRAQGDTDGNAGQGPAAKAPKKSGIR